MNRLMHPIGPGGKRPADPADHPSLDLPILGHEPRLPPIFPFLGASGGWKDSQRRYRNIFLQGGTPQTFSSAEQSVWVPGKQFSFSVHPQTSEQT